MLLKLAVDIRSALRRMTPEGRIQVSHSYLLLESVNQIEQLLTRIASSMVEDSDDSSDDSVITPIGPSGRVGAYPIPRV